jgi:hypothetical protein
VKTITIDQREIVGVCLMGAVMLIMTAAKIIIREWDSE